MAQVRIAPSAEVRAARLAQIELIRYMQDVLGVKLTTQQSRRVNAERVCKIADEVVATMDEVTVIEA